MLQSPRRNISRAVFAISLVVLLNMIAFGVTTPLLPLYAERLRLRPSTIGWVIGIYSAMQLLFTPILGKASDRFGRRPVLMLSLFGTALGFFVIAEAKSAVVLFIGRIIDGVTGSNVSVTQAYIADISSPEKRSRYMGITAGAFGLGLAVGPFLGGILSRISYKAPFLFAAAISAATATLVGLILPEGRQDRPASTRATMKGRIFTPVIGTYVCLSAGLAMVTTVFGLFCEKRFGYDFAGVAFIFGYFGIILVIVQLFVVGMLLRFITDRHLALIGLSLMGVSIAALAYAYGIVALLLVCTGIAVGDGLATPALTGLVSRMGDPGVQGRSLGYFQAGGALARLVGPILAGSLLALDSPRPEVYAKTAIWASAAICLIGTMTALRIRDSGPA
jgi:multidrug resistance protein